jgi:hypothetical protein
MAAHDARMVRLREYRERRALQVAVRPAGIRELQALRARQHWVAQPEPQAAAPSVQRQGAPSWPEVRPKGPFGFVAPERPAFWFHSARAQFLAQAVRPEAVRLAARPEPAARRGARQEVFAPAASAAWLAGSLAPRVPGEAAWQQAGSGALPRAGCAEAALRAALGAAAARRLAGAPLAVPGPAAGRLQEVRDALEVQHGAAVRAQPSEAGLSALPSVVAFHVLSHDRVRFALAQFESVPTALAMPCFRTASPSEPSWQAARDEVLS